MKDIQIKKLIETERKRQKKVINLIASENYVSKDVLEALGSELTNKYAEGYPGKRYYGGNDIVDRVEQLCMDRALKLFKLDPKEWHVNVQPLSGSPANLAVYTALVPHSKEGVPAAKIIGMSLDQGGHLTHGHKVSATGKFWTQVPYGVDATTELINYDQLREIAMKEKPAIIVTGYTAYPRTIDWARMREVANAAEALLMVDMSHIAGLVAGGVYPSPFDFADVVTTTTHKTLRGPRGGLILCKEEFAKRIDSAVFPGGQGGPLMHIIAAKAVCFREAAKPEFKDYAIQVKRNASVMAETFINRGYKILSGGTDNHLLLIDLRQSHPDLTGKQAQQALDEANITTNKNTIPGETRSPFQASGLRLGSPAVTSRGMREAEMVQIAEAIDVVLGGPTDPARIARAKAVALELCRRFPLPY